MYVLILIITLVSADPQTPQGLRQSADRTRSWSVASEQDAAILVYERQQKAVEYLDRVEAKLYRVDLEKMTVKEITLPKLTFSQINRIEALKNELPVDEFHERAKEKYPSSSIMQINEFLALASRWDDEHSRILYREP